MQPNPALEQMLRDSGDLDRILDGRGLIFENEPNPVVPAPPPLRIEAPDWEAERLEREQRDREKLRQARARIVAEELARITDDSEQPEARPAKPRKWRK